LGTNSIGLALIESAAQKPSGLIRAAVRVFDAGVEGDIESGRDASRNVKRREGRLVRRTLQRRARRLTKLANLLQRAALLPKGDLGDGERRDRFLADLDKAIYSRYRDRIPRTTLDQLPYFLRARALDENLAPDEFGRAIYHLAQRRGFKSNRKAPPKKDEDPGVVKKAVAELAQDMTASGARTLGEYLSRLDPHKQRLRGRWTARKMYEDEFDALWAAQAKHHSDLLTDALRDKVREAIFYQRPLKSARHLIGVCSLEPGHKRARRALLVAQRFRMVQRVNDLLVVDTQTGEVRPLTADQRETLLAALDRQVKISFAGIRKALKLKKCKFNLEEGGEKELRGNSTAARLRRVFGDRWDALTNEDRDRIVQDLLSIDSADVLEARGREVWGLDDDAAARFATTTLETDHADLSTKAMKKLLPLMEQGVHYATARKQAGYEVLLRQPVVDELPPVHEALPALRNPTVARVLAELRRVVNAAVREHGKPAAIRVELARDLKKTRKDRKGIWQRNRANQKARGAAVKKIQDEAGLEPRGIDIEKVLLAEECGWLCPYTGKGIAMRALVGPSPQFDVEHIIPLSRCFDNSFFNKTLCYHEENRNRKRGRTPFEAYSADSGNYGAILERVKKFKGDKRIVREKLRRFKADHIEDFDDFTNRQLSDTRYASRLAADYVALLYGGRIDEDGTLRVQVGRGQITKYLRDEWGLNAVLGDGGTKSRDDHRHHAVDAVCIALTTPATVKMLSDAAERAQSAGRRRFAPVPPPWPGFLDDVRRSIDGLVVSHRADRAVRGPLHEETIYSPLIREVDDDDNVIERHHVRKPLESLSAKAMKNQIVDKHVRAAVLAKLDELGGDPKAFTDEKNHPRLNSGIPVHKVRIRVPEKATAVGKGYRQRHVLTGSNHHVEIFAVPDGKGGTKWDGEIVTMLEAYRRVKAGEPVVRRDHGPRTRFLFSLCGGDTVELTTACGRRALYVVRTITKEGMDEHIRFLLAPVNDARRKADMIADAVVLRPGVESFRKKTAQKVTVSPLGEVRRAND